MRKMALFVCMMILASTMFSYFSIVFASDDLDESVNEITDSALSKVIIIDGKAYNPGAYYITTNSFKVRSNADFSDLITKVYNERTREYDEVPHEAKREILMAARVGFLEGYEDGTFKPDDEITRAEFIKMLMCLLTNRTFNFEAVPTLYYNWAGKFVTLAEMQGIIENRKYT